MAGLQAELTKALPAIPDARKAALQQARVAVTKATAEAKKAQEALGKVSTAKALVDHANGKWLGGAAKGIAAAEAALKKAKTDAERTAANQELTKWQANREEGLKALAERQAGLTAAKLEEPKLLATQQAAQAELAKAQAAELEAAFALGILPVGDNAEGRFVRENGVVVEIHLLARIVVDLVPDRRRILAEIGEFADVIDYAAGVALAATHLLGTYLHGRVVGVVACGAGIGLQRLQSIM